MLDGQKLQLEATEKRAALRKMALDPGPRPRISDAKPSSRRSRQGLASQSAVEEVVELAKVEPTEDSETRERRELRSKARVSDFVGPYSVAVSVAGASANTPMPSGVPGLMPMELWRSEEWAVTPGPADDGDTTRPTVPYAFAVPTRRRWVL